MAAGTIGAEVAGNGAGGGTVTLFATACPRFSGRSYDIGPYILFSPISSSVSPSSSSSSRSSRSSANNAIPSGSSGKAGGMVIDDL